MKKLILVLCAALLATSAFAGQPSFKRVFIVILENTDAADALRQPFMGRLASEGSYLNRYSAITHPSQPNYIGLTSGSTWGFYSDRPITLNVRHIGNLLEEKGKTWKTYAEGYPGNCYLRPSKGAYGRKHVPFLSYRNVQEDKARCARVVNSDELKKDIEAGTLPDYALYIPDDKSNGHNTGVVYADCTMAKTFGPLLEDKRFTEGTLFIMTFDEGTRRRGNLIYTVLWGDSVVPHYRSDTRYTHYSLLRTIEDAFGLGTLGKNDAEAQPITDVWR